MAAHAVHHAPAVVIFRAGTWLRLAARRIDAWLSARTKARADSLALEGMTDEELSDRLCLSLSAVKKRWAAVYDHVSMKGIHAGLPACEGKRGPERRRLLLEYLRWHPEELNPIALH